MRRDVSANPLTLVSVIVTIMATEPQPLWAATPSKIEEAVRRIVEAANPVRVILFGSQARRDAGQDSDVDLLVVEREVVDRYAESVRLHRILRGLILAVDLVVMSEREFEEWADTPGSLARAACREGQVLHETA
jgi:predicted nucleotidyltransferase